MYGFQMIVVACFEGFGSLSMRLDGNFDWSSFIKVLAAQVVLIFLICRTLVLFLEMIATIVLYIVLQRDCSRQP